MVYAGASDNKIYSFTKQGQPGTVYSCDNAVYSCATAEQGKYVFAGDNFSSVYCFDQQGQRIWKLGTGCGSALSMQFFKDRLYIVTTNGDMACIDVSEAAITAAQTGTLPAPAQIKAPAAPAPVASTTLATTTSAGTGVVVQCVRDGGKLRIKVVSPGYNSSLYVQFPQNLRQENARYVVDEVRLVAHGGFYRAYGDIKQLI